jgi:hypothetical protein
VEPIANYQDAPGTYKMRIKTLAQETLSQSKRGKMFGKIPMKF